MWLVLCGRGPSGSFIGEAFQQPDRPTAVIEMHSDNLAKADG